LVSSVVDDKIELISKLENGGNISVEIYDLIGNLKDNFSYSADKGYGIKEIGIDNLQAGSYFLNVNYGNETMKLKIIVID
jgi:hypothetical protein